MLSLWFDNYYRSLTSKSQRQSARRERQELQLCEALLYIQPDDAFLSFVLHMYLLHQVTIRNFFNPSDHFTYQTFPKPNFDNI